MTIKEELGMMCLMLAVLINDEQTANMIDDDLKHIIRDHASINEFNEDELIKIGNVIENHLITLTKTSRT